MTDTKTPSDETSPRASLPAEHLSAEAVLDALKMILFGAPLNSTLESVTKLIRATAKECCARSSFLIQMANTCTYASAGGNKQEVKRLYKELIDDENRHDLNAVRKLVWKSPSTLFVAKAPKGWHGYWGIDDVIQHLPRGA